MLSGLLGRIDAAMEADSAELADAQPAVADADLDEAEVEFDFGPVLET